MTKKMEDITKSIYEKVILNFVNVAVEWLSPLDECKDQRSLQKVDPLSFDT